MIRLVELSKSFELGDRSIVAVDRLSLEVRQGEVYGLLGPNGAGKTTTLRMVLGLLRADSGYAEIDGFRSSTDDFAVRSRIGFVTCNDGLYSWLTVREILSFYADLYGIPSARAQQRIEHLAELLRLRDFLDRRAATLSTGQRQRAVLARGMVHDPPVMLLDEPTRGLDILGSQVVFDYLQQLKEQGKAVILSTHRLDEAERTCDRFGLLHLGLLRHEGTMDELRAQTGKQRLLEMFQEFVFTTESERGDKTTAEGLPHGT